MNGNRSHRTAKMTEFGPDVLHVTGIYGLKSIIVHRIGKGGDMDGVVSTLWIQPLEGHSVKSDDDGRLVVVRN